MSRSGAAALAVVLMLAAAAPSAWAAPPTPDPGALPDDTAQGGEAVTQIGECSETILASGAQRTGQPSPDVTRAWQFSQGEGQTVAVIDTGVRPSQRLPVEPGGDYIQSTDGLADCDGHGTVVAGIIGARPGEDGFSGVAPQARLVSIRQSSSKFSQRAPGADPAVSGLARAVQTLARAVVRAADLGATVIDVSTAVCVSSAKPVDQAALGAALRYAAVDKDAVIVAAAGDLGGSGQDCRTNPLSGAGEDPRNWSGVESVSVPSWWQPFVLSVGSASASGVPSKSTMPGPWVGVAGPGEQVVSLSNGPRGGLADAVIGQDGKPVPLSGTGYAAAYVAGVAALVRSRFPELSASEVSDRLQKTVRLSGRSPSNLVGTGLVDPVNALTWELPAGGRGPAGPSTRTVVPPAPPPPQDPLPRRLAFAGSGSCLIVALAAAAVSARRRKNGAE
jgi:membrane-anchored mycosin MYCP